MIGAFSDDLFDGLVFAFGIAGNRQVESGDLEILEQQASGFGVPR